SSYIALAPRGCQELPAICVRLSVAPRATAHDGPESHRGATKKFHLFAFRIDRKAHELTVNFQIGKESRRVFMKMQHRIAATVKGAAFLFRQPFDLSDLAQNRLELVERLRSRVFHEFLGWITSPSGSRM